MPTTYKGLTVPLSSDLADGPVAFRDYTDSLPTGDAVKAAQLPVGTVVSTVALVAPTGFLLLDGTLIAGGQSLWPALWAVVPAAWHVGTDLQLPNAKGRILIGIDPANTAIDAPGELAGSASLTGANLPPHTHTQAGTFTSGPQSADHTHMPPAGAQFVITAFSTALSVNSPGGAGAAGLSFPGGVSANHSHNTTISGETGPGPSTATPFLPPVLALNYIIKAA
jgi:hypothetical protein